MDVSIVIPSYNKFPLNFLTLYSLELQSYITSKYEVIFIDDASTDQTYNYLSNYHPNFDFKYIKNPVNLGRAASRNKGISEAKGDIIIFLDSEVIVDRDFVLNHVNHHINNDFLVVSGIMNSFYIVYSYFFSEFTKEQRKVLQELIFRNPRLYRSHSKLIKHIRDYRDLKGIGNRIFNNNPVEILNKEDINSGNYKSISIKHNYYENEILNFVGEELNGFELAWIGFLTGNVSVKKSNLTNTGMFDENFKAYGFEDWDLGFRLYKNGLKFIAPNNLYCYHQEHPFNSKNRNREHKSNFIMFLKKHNKVDIGLLLLVELGKKYIEINEIVKELRLIEENENAIFLELEKVLILFFEEVAQQMGEGIVTPKVSELVKAEISAQIEIFTKQNLNFVYRSSKNLLDEINHKF